MGQTIRRALLSVSDKEGLLEFARALRGRGVELLSTGGTAAAAARGRDRGDRRLRRHGLPRDHGRPREDAAPEDPRRPARPRGTDDAVMAEHGIEPIDLVVVNLYPFAATVAKAGCTHRGRDREHRHRRAGDGAGRGQEPRARHHRRGPARLRHRARRDRARGRQRLRGDPPAARDQGLRAHGPVRRGGRGLPRPRRAQRHRERIPRPAGPAVPQAPRPALRREPAPAGRVLRRHRQPGRVGGLGLAAAGQGALLQQPRRRGHRLRVRAAVRGARLRDREARQPLRRRRGGQPARGLRPCVPHRPDLGVRRHHRLQPPARRRDRTHHRRAAVRRGDRRAVS